MNKKNDFANRFDRRFGVTPCAGLGSIGSLGAGVQLKKCSDAILERKKAAMYEAMAKLKVRREQAIAAKAQQTPHFDAPQSAPVTSANPVVSMEEFLAQVAQSTLEDINRGLAGDPDSKHMAMYEAMKVLLERRKTMPPAPREKRMR